MRPVTDNAGHLTPRDGRTPGPPAGQMPESYCYGEQHRVAVEVGFEPTEDLRLHTLSNTARQRSPPYVTCAGRRPTAAGERPRTGMNETKTEPSPVPVPRCHRRDADQRRPSRWIGGRQGLEEAPTRALEK